MGWARHSVRMVEREQFIERGRETWRKVSGWNTFRRGEKTIKLMLKKWCTEGMEFFQNIEECHAFVSTHLYTIYSTQNMIPIL